MADNKKQGRVAERIKEILSDLIQFEASDPRLSGTTILDVEVDRELMYATVYVTALDGEEARERVLEGLQAAGGFLRREMGQQLQLRRVPELRFNWDETAAYGSHIDRLLDELNIPTPADDADEAS